MELASSRNQGYWEQRLHHRRNWYPPCFPNYHRDLQRRKEKNEENENMSDECKIEEGAKRGEREREKLKENDDMNEDVSVEIGL